MSGELGSGAADRARAPRPPDNSTPVSPDAQRPQHDAGHPANQTAQPDGRPSRDNHGPAGPQGGKPADVGGPKGDTASHQADDKTGKTSDTHHSGDGPVKINDVPGPRSADGPRRGGDQPPGPRVSTDFAAWKAQYESHSAPHPEAATVHASEVKRPAELPPLRYSYTLDLNEKTRDSHGNLVDKFRNSDGKLDWGKVRAELNHIKHQALDKARHEPWRPSGTPGSRELRIRPIEITVDLQHAKTGTERVLVRAAFQEVAKASTDWRVRTYVPDPPRYRPDIPGPKTEPDAKPGTGGTRRGPDQPHTRGEHQEVHPQIQPPRQVPPVRQVQHIQPHFPGR